MFKICRVPVSPLYLRIIYRCINFLAGLSRCINLVLHQKFAYTFLGIQQTILRQIFYAFFGEFALRGDCTVYTVEYLSPTSTTVFFIASLMT